MKLRTYPSLRGLPRAEWLKAYRKLWVKRNPTYMRDYGRQYRILYGS